MQALPPHGTTESTWAFYFAVESATLQQLLSVHRQHSPSLTFRVAVHVLLATSHSRTVLSLVAPLAKVRPSGLQATLATQSKWPCKQRRCG